MNGGQKANFLWFDCSEKGHSFLRAKSMFLEGKRPRG